MVNSITREEHYSGYDTAMNWQYILNLEVKPQLLQAPSRHGNHTPQTSTLGYWDTSIKQVCRWNIDEILSVSITKAGNYHHHTITALAWVRITSYTTNLIIIHRSIYLTRDFHGLIKEVCFVQRLSVIQPIVVNFRVEYSQLLIAVCSIDEVLQLVVAVTKKRQRWAWLNTHSRMASN